MNFADQTTKIVSATTKFLLLDHPYRTSLGTVLGLSIYVLTKIFSPFFNRYASVIDVSQITAWGCVFIGLLLMHSPSLLKILFGYKDVLLAENDKKALLIIEEGKKLGHLSEKKAGDLYLQLAERALRNTQGHPQVRKEQG